MDIEKGILWRSPVVKSVGLRASRPNPIQKGTPLHLALAAGVRCGAEKCLNLAFVWLTASEQRSYLNGQHFFRYSGHAAGAELI